MPIQSVFISYTRDDTPLVEPLEQALKARHFTVWRDQHSVYGGVNWPRLIGEAIRDHDAVVLCWSAKSSRSHFVEMEWSIALALKKVIIPYRLDGTNLHPSLVHKHGVRTTDRVLRALGTAEPGNSDTEDVVLDALDGVTEPAPDRIAHMVRDTLKVYVSGGTNNVAQTINQYFGGDGGRLPKHLTRSIPRVPADRVVGREAELQDLHALLFNNQPVVLVNGLGGIGKTTLAQAYIGRHSAAYHHLAWVSQLSDEFEVDFIGTDGLLERLGVEKAGKNVAELYNEAMAALGRIPEGPNLLVIDNALGSFQPFVSTLPAASKWHVLVTSREHLRGLAQKELGFLSQAEAIRLFRLHYTRKALSDDAILRVIRAVDRHTLTIEILARTAHRQRLPVYTLQQAIEADLRAGVYTNYQNDRIERVTSYLRSIFKVSDLEPASHDYWLLGQLSCLPPNFHPYDLLADLIAPEVHGRADVFSETLEALVEKGWLLVDEKEEAYKMHRIVQEVVKREIPMTDEEVLPLVEALASLLEIDQTKDNPADKFPWAPFGEMVLDRIGESTDEKVALLQNNLGLVLMVMGDYEGAKGLLEKAVVSDERTFGMDHPTTAIRYSNLALVLKDLGDYEGAKVLLEKAVVSDERTFGEDHPATAIRYSNLALVLKDLGDYEGAKGLLEKAVVSAERTFDMDHPITAIRYSNLALVLQALGDYEGAKVLLEKAVGSAERTFGLDHPTTAKRYSNLALVLQDLGDYEGAKGLLEKAVGSAEGTFGLDHPTTAIRYWNMAALLRDLKKYKEAFAYIEKALNIYRTTLPEDHPYIARVNTLYNDIKSHL